MVGLVAFVGEFGLVALVGEFGLVGLVGEFGLVGLVGEFGRRFSCCGVGFLSEICEVCGGCTFRILLQMKFFRLFRTDMVCRVWSFCRWFSNGCFVVPRKGSKT